MLGEARQYFSASKMECEGDFQVVQWLRLHASNAGVWSLEGELRSYKLQGVAKKKKKEEEEEERNMDNEHRQEGAEDFYSLNFLQKF